jgi:pimeloyl-ACP methyl ester carboxylesterase
MLLLALACWRDDAVDTGSFPGTTDDTGLGCVADAYPATLANSTLGERWGSFEWEARDGVVQTAWTYMPTSWDGESVLFVVHGSSRNVDRYLLAFAPVGERNGALVIAPHFTDEDYPSTEDWTLGVGLDGTPYGEGFHEGEWRNSDDYTLSEIEHVYEALRTELSLTSCRYDIVGHSAGSQFVQRLAVFRPDARFSQAIAANSGWYTLPGTLDSMPYGLEGSPLEGEGDRSAMLGRPLTLLLGELDTETPEEDSALRDTEQANAQGRNRLQRGRYAIGVAMKEANTLDVALGWRSVEVPGAGHDKDEMSQSAGLLFAGVEPCETSVAVDLQLNEILADPPDDLPGDANGDGTRDPYDDEFIELVNTGSSSVCLQGWRVEESHLGRTHVFPVGTVLEPGKALVVFGDGVPTGPFGGSGVQWAAHTNELDLQNSGDVLRVLSPDDVEALAFSWGDCGDGTCADDHYDGELNINQSLVRDTEGTWKPHGFVSSSLFSPGTRSDGEAF